jgi:uncharacterized membrane protein YfcA
VPEWSHVAAGALTGFVVGLTGVGGGALMTPILLLVFGVAPHTAIGTDLWFAALTKLAVTRVHYGKNLIDWPVLRRLWLGSLPASAATIVWITYLPVTANTTGVLRGGVAIAVCLTAVGMFAQKALQAFARRRLMESSAPFIDWQPALTTAAGALLGILVTLTSVGAGAIGVVLLVFLYPSRLTPPRLVATDIAHAIPLALFAATGHLLTSHVDVRLLGGLLLGSIPAGLLGATLSSRLRHDLLRVALALVLLLIGLKLASEVF